MTSSECVEELARVEAERDRALDALEDMFWQHAYTVGDEPLTGSRQRYCGGLSANEYALAVLVDLKGWTRINSQVGEAPNQ